MRSRRSQIPRPPSYRYWLTPVQLADRFGATVADLTALRQWLEGQGFPHP
ncbi:MAG: protease pro-enzyme activation domain-containing protein [Bryobacteraceae bacterium]